MRGLLVAVCAVVALVPGLVVAQEEAPPEVTPEQALKDAQAIIALYEEHHSKFEGVHGNEMVGETTEEGRKKRREESLAKLEALEKDVYPALHPPMADFAAKYLPEEINPDNIAMEVGNRFFDLGIKGGDLERDIGGTFRDLYQDLENIAKSRAASAEYLGDSVKNMPDPSFFDEAVRLDKMNEWKTTLEWALKFNPNDEYANQRLATIDQEIADLEKQIEAEIDGREWAGHVDAFAGPGDVAGLSQAALDFFRNDRDWGKSEKPVDVLAVAVRGTWQVAETNILGQPIRWRLPIHVAATKPQWKEQGLARVYELSAVSPLGAGKSVPFDGYWVGDSWMFRLNKLPGQ